MGLDGGGGNVIVVHATPKGHFGRPKTVRFPATCHLGTLPRFVRADIVKELLAALNPIAVEGLLPTAGSIRMCGCVHSSDPGS